MLVSLATDIILLLIMFFGLLRLGFHERGVLGLGRLLWRQVGHRFFSLTVVLSADMVFRIYKGVIWLLVATIAEVLPGVNDLIHVPYFSAHRNFCRRCSCV
jgi:hypothetical protein